MLWLTLSIHLESSGVFFRSIFTEGRSHTKMIEYRLNLTEAIARSATLRQSLWATVLMFYLI